MTIKIDVPIGPNINEIYYKHAPRTFTYPTIGILEPGKMFNDTLVEKKDLAEFGRVFNDLMKPYNVHRHQHRTQIADCKNMDSGKAPGKTEHMWYVTIFLLKHTP